jgi:hypothetical protein
MVSLGLCLIAMALVAGCGKPADKGVNISGKATLNGTNLEMGMVVFEPEAGGEAKTGQIIPDGTFKLYSITPGKYKVAVRTAMFASRAASSPPKKVGGKQITIGQMQGRFQPVPTKYEDTKTSNLQIEVKPGTELNLELVGK